MSHASDAKENKESKKVANDVMVQAKSTVSTSLSFSISYPITLRKNYQTMLIAL